ncbi:uncharacterized protein LOC136072292 isoform X1 [Hydra vulgaris]|uniref:uncharacterized protein LOC136072292 isoform X1 n=1 Tax=Hydra vulgaris TaxID=6087 RepID=UPI0032E9EC69
MLNDVKSHTSDKQDKKKNEIFQKKNFLKGISFKKLSPKDEKLSSKNEKFASKKNNLFKSLFRNKIKISDNAELNEIDQKEEIQSALQDAKMSFDSGINMFTNVKNIFQAAKEKSTKTKKRFWNFVGCYENKKEKNTQTQLRFDEKKITNNYIENEKTFLSDDGYSNSLDDTFNNLICNIDEEDFVTSDLQNIERKIGNKSAELRNFVLDENNFNSFDDQSLSIILSNIEKDSSIDQCDNVCDNDCDIDSLFSNFPDSDNLSETNLNQLSVFKKFIANLKIIQKRVHIFRSSRRIHPINVKDVEVSKCVCFRINSQSKCDNDSCNLKDILTIKKYKCKTEADEINFKRNITIDKI